MSDIFSAKNAKMVAIIFAAFVALAYAGYTPASVAGSIKQKVG